MRKVNDALLSDNFSAASRLQNCRKDLRNALTNKGTATAQNPPFLNAFRRIPPTAPGLGVWSALECRVAGLDLQQLANPAVRRLQALCFLAVVHGQAFGVDELDIGDADEAQDLTQILCL